MIAPTRFHGETLGIPLRRHEQGFVVSQTMSGSASSPSTARPRAVGRTIF